MGTDRPEEASAAARRPGGLVRLGLLILCLWGGASCQHWDPDWWSFPMTRRAYARQTMTGWGETHPGNPGTDPDVEGYSGGEEELWFLPFTLVLPLLVDLVVLPVTLVHDVLVVD